MEFLPVLFMVTGIVLVATATLFVSSLLRPSNPYPEKNAPYECGMEAAGGPRAAASGFLSLSSPYSSWSSMSKRCSSFLGVVLKEIGIVGYIEMFVFMLLLLVGFAYAWLKGALEWQE